MMDRRTLLKLLLASAMAEAVDFERLLWVPKPIITVPQFRLADFVFDPKLTEIAAQYVSFRYSDAFPIQETIVKNARVFIR